MLSTIVLVAGVICLFLAAIGVSVSRVNLGWLGVPFVVLAVHVI